METRNGSDKEDSPHKKMLGVILVDEAHNMVPDQLDNTFQYLMKEIQRYQEQAIFLITGPLEQM